VVIIIASEGRTCGLQWFVVTRALSETFFIAAKITWSYECASNKYLYRWIEFVPKFENKISL